MNKQKININYQTPPKNIILIGFMGAGKTTLGKELADKLNYTFLDTDQAIERQIGQTVAEIIKEKGLETFRTYEKNLCETLPTLTNHVISTGGGMPIDTNNQINLLKTGEILYLNTPFPTIWKRIKNDPARPLAVHESKESLLSCYNKRHPIYLSLSTAHNQ